MLVFGICLGRSTNEQAHRPVTRSQTRAQAQGHVVFEVACQNIAAFVEKMPEKVAKKLKSTERRVSRQCVDIASRASSVVKKSFLGIFVRGTFIELWKAARRRVWILTVLSSPM
jgi:hypothetical protein